MSFNICRGTLGGVAMSPRSETPRRASAASQTSARLCRLPLVIPLPSRIEEVRFG
jgi:hypothetical protein